jgi:hypothetical protein
MVLGGRAIYGDDIQALRRMMETEQLDAAARRQHVRQPNVLAPTATASWATSGWRAP